MCDTALGPTTQSKLTVQAPSIGERGPRQKRHPWRIGGSARPCALPLSGVGRFNGSLQFCLRKDLALVSHCVLGLGRGNGEEWDLSWVTAHSMCTVLERQRGRGTVLNLHSIVT
ncbi:hypothetical protein [Desulfosporosinus sp. BG]|uniref:hypothetical protein n=1 Tax=Desulfosporosinus sp. BG TaxID=1633135 RepID=UPI00114D02B0|nr:hypothetical protein [Desulfosporosinus sp. BG]